ncbi:MAG: histidine ammonia-lyase, partial [Fidelibacterota bacterium]
MEIIEIDGESLNLDILKKIVYENRKLKISEDSIEKMKNSRQVVEKALNDDVMIYGINTGFGRLSNVKIDRDKVKLLQRNLVRSHAGGVGKNLSNDIVRAVMAIKINALAKGYSGCRPQLASLMVEMLNREIYPLIPEKGSVGASGDLAPLAHLALVLIGEGEVYLEGEILPGFYALKKVGLNPLTLEAKEGLSILNGTQVMTAIAALALLKLKNIAKAADIIAAMTAEAVLATDAAFDQKIHSLRGLECQKRVAENLRKLLHQSEIIESHKKCERVQDPYSIRCIPQVHGASREVFQWSVELVEKEMNAASDNPLVFADKANIISGGNFHG